MNKHLTKSIKLLVFSYLLGMACQSYAELVVIVHPSNTSTINEQHISRLYLGKLRAFPSGKAALPIDQPRKSAIRNEFAKKALKKSPHQLRSYWSKIIFSGKGFPPEVLENDQKVKSLVASNPAAIGYIDNKLVDESVRVIRRY